MAYCLDTNTIVFCLRGKSPQAMTRLHAMPTSEVGVPMQVLAELRVGPAKSAKP
jgi:predicted nucleic acid-binding protein